LKGEDVHAAKTAEPEKRVPCEKEDGKDRKTERETFEQGEKKRKKIKYIGPKITKEGELDQK